MHNVSDWLQWIKNYHDQAINYSLDNVSLIARHLSVQEFPVPVIVVAGTNGKGSCVASMEALLLAHGYTVGTYTSPHLFNFCERIRINAIPIHELELCALLQQVQDCVLENNKIPLSMFEFVTMAALLAFKQHNVDYVLLEVGLGGRLDAVNVVRKNLAVITSIALDHCALLGNTREEIGFEKAGIITGTIPVIYADPDMPNSIGLQVTRHDACLYRVGRDYTCQQEQESWSFKSLSTKKNYYSKLALTSFPIANAAAALQALSVLPNIQLNSRIVESVFMRLQVLGRFQVEHQGGREIIFDVAHNPAAIVCLVQNLQKRASILNTVAIVGIAATKDVGEIFKHWNYPVSRWLTCEPRGMRKATSCRALSTAIVASQAGVVDEFASVTEALSSAYACTKSGDRILVFGSFHTVAEALQDFYKGITKE